MNLTDQQIDSLYTFTKQHYVNYYDVQTELVDHMANDIEAIWEREPKLSFDEAKQQSFKKFGVFGFMEVVEQKQKQMQKKYWRILWGFTKEWFTIPKIILTGIIFMAIFNLLQFRESIAVLTILMVIVIVFVFTCDVIIRLKLKKKKKKNEKIFLLEEMLHKTNSYLLLLNLVQVLNFFSIKDIDFSTMATPWVLLISFLLTLFVLVFYIVEFVMPKKAEELLSAHYPEYKLVKNL